MATFAEDIFYFKLEGGNQLHRSISHMLNHLRQDNELLLVVAGVWAIFIFLLLLIFATWKEERWIRVVKFFSSRSRRRKRGS